MLLTSKPKNRLPRSTCHIDGPDYIDVARVYHSVVYSPLMSESTGSSDSLEQAKVIQQHFVVAKNCASLP